MEVRQATVESRQLPVATSRELREVGIGHLPMTDNTADLDISERDAVGPELVASHPLECADDITRGRGELAAPEKESNETSLGNRARGEWRLSRR